MFEDFRREMHLSDVSGHRFRMSLSELRHAMLSATGLTFLGLALAMLLFSDPPGLLNHMPVATAAAIWITSLFCYLAGLFICLDMAGRLQKMGRVKTIWLPLVSLLALTPTVSATELMVFALVGPDYPVLVLPKVIFYFVIVQIMEFAFVRFVLVTPAQASGADDNAPSETEPVLRLGARRLPLRRLRYVVAQEHYVEIVLDADRILKRARLSDVLAQLDTCDGVQPHRSWWVSRHAAPKLERRGARYVIITDDRTEVPVARGRSEAVVAWFDRHGPFGSPVPG